MTSSAKQQHATWLVPVVDTLLDKITTLIALVLQEDGRILNMQLGAPKALLQHLFTSTTVNFTTSPVRSKQEHTTDPIQLPLAHFINSDGFTIPELGLDKIDTSPRNGRFDVPYKVYTDTIQQ